MTSAAKTSKKLTKEQKLQAIELARQGFSVGEVCRQLGCTDAEQRVAGVLVSARNSGKLSEIPKGPTDGGSMPPPPAPPTPGAAPAAAPVSSPDDGYAWTAAPPGTGSFAHPAQTVKYLVERTNPQDGLVGSHSTPPSDDEIGNTYGSGVYTVVKQAAGKLPEHRQVHISQSFGPPKFPRRMGSASTPPPAPERPQAPVRPFPSRFRHPSQVDEEDERGGPRPTGYRPYRHEYERDLSRFARHGGDDESVTITVVDKLANLQEKTLDRLEDKARTGPDSFVKDFYTERQRYEDKQREDQRKKEDELRDKERERDADARKREQDHQDQRRRDDEDRHRRWQEDQDKRHERDLERIREERKTMVDLEEAKLTLIKTEAKAREDLLQKEIEAARERADQAQAGAEERVAAMTASLEKRLQDDKESLNKQHNIREKALDNDHSLRREMVELEKKIAQAGSKDELSAMLGTLVEGVKDIVGKVTATRQMELSTAEGQAALLAQQQAAAAAAAGGEAPVNVQEVPPGAAPAPMPQGTTQAQPRAAVAAAQGAPQPGNGNGHGAEAPQPQEGTPSMEQVIATMTERPFFKEVLKEWAAHVEAGNDSSTFANMYMEWMRDEGTPEAAEARKACTMFANFMAIRDWKAMFPHLKPGIPAEKHAVMQGEAAEEFYEGFRTMVVESVRDYWKAYFEQKRQEREAARIAREQRAAQQSAAPAQAAAPAPAAAPTPAPPSTATPVATPVAARQEGSAA